MHASRFRRVGLVMAALAAGAVALGAAGCGTAKKNPKASASADSTAESNLGGAPDTVPLGADQNNGGTGANGTNGGNGTNGQSSPRPNSSTSKAATTGPQLVYFRVTQQPSCPAGTNVAPIEGKPV